MRRSYERFLSSLESFSVVILHSKDHTLVYFHRMMTCSLGDWQNVGRKMNLSLGIPSKCTTTTRQYLNAPYSWLSRDIRLRTAENPT